MRWGQEFSRVPSRLFLPRCECCCLNFEATSKTEVARSQLTPGFSRLSFSGLGWEGSTEHRHTDAGLLPRNQVVEAGSIRPAPVILQSLQLQLLIASPAFLSFLLFFLWMNFHFKLGQVVRAVQPGQACWVLSWRRLIKKKKTKNKKAESSIHICPRPVPSQFQDLWVGGGEVRKGRLI